MKARRLLDEFFGPNGLPVKKVPESKRTVEHDKWDEEDYQAILMEVKPLSVAEDKLSEYVETGDSAMADTYFSLSKVVVELKDEKDIRPSYLVNRTVMSESHDLKEYKELRLNTEGDPIAAALGCNTMEPDLEILFDKLREEQKLANELEKQM